MDLFIYIIDIFEYCEGGGVQGKTTGKNKNNTDVDSASPSHQINFFLFSFYQIM